jgi:hypothetical protein
LKIYQQINGGFKDGKRKEETRMEDQDTQEEKTPQGGQV